MQVANADWVLLTDVRRYMKYEDNKATDEIAGYRYSVVAPNNKYASFDIKVEGATAPVISQEELNEKGAVKIKPINFQGGFYRNRNTGEYQFTAKATSIEVMK